VKTWRYTWRGHFSDGVQTSNSLHFVSQPGALEDDPSAEAVLNKVDDALSAAYYDCQSVEWNSETIVVSECLPSSSSDIPAGHVKDVTGTSGPHGSGTHHLPEALCAIISLQTGVPRRWARGYIALPSIVGSDFLDTDGQWSGSYATSLATFAALLDDDYDFGGTFPVSLIPVVYSRTRHNLGLDPHFAQVQAGVVKDSPRWRRSRLTAP
jgi:hypothetical protein